jgi:acyl-CoA synthetase (AMP-forming)/AMP-acid ligase II
MVGITRDIVEERDGYYKVTGRTSEVINIAEFKFMACEVEFVALRFDGVELANTEAKPNPITGQQVELKLRPAASVENDKGEPKAFLVSSLRSQKVPKRLRFSGVAAGHRFKRG